MVPFSQETNGKFINCVISLKFLSKITNENWIFYDKNQFKKSTKIIF